MDYSTMLVNRRSCRRFKNEEIDPSAVSAILRAALMSPTSRNNRSWQFVVVDDKTDLQKLSDAKESGAAFLAQAALAIVVTGNPTTNDCWVEDGSIAAFAMQMQAEELSLGSCWVQIRGRYLSDGTKAEDVVRGILDIPEEQSILCILAIGKKQDCPPPHDEENLKWENVHIDKWMSRRVDE